MNKDALRTQINQTLEGMTARSGLLAMLDSPRPTTLNALTTKYYQDGPINVAMMVEAMIEEGVVIPAETNRWWPSATADLHEILRGRGLSVQGNPPAIHLKSRLGNSGYATISAPTAAAVEDAIERASADMACEDAIERMRIWLDAS